MSNTCCCKGSNCWRYRSYCHSCECEAYPCRVALFTNCSYVCSVGCSCCKVGEWLACCGNCFGCVATQTNFVAWCCSVPREVCRCLCDVVYCQISRSIARFRLFACPNLLYRNVVDNCSRLSSSGTIVLPNKYQLLRCIWYVRNCNREILSSWYHVQEVVRWMVCEQNVGWIRVYTIVYCWCCRSVIGIGICPIYFQIVPWAFSLYCQVEADCQRVAFSCFKQLFCNYNTCRTCVISCSCSVVLWDEQLSVCNIPFVCARTVLQQPTISSFFVKSALVRYIFSFLMCSKACRVRIDWHIGSANASYRKDVFGCVIKVCQCVRWRSNGNICKFAVACLPIRNDIAVCCTFPSNIGRVGCYVAYFNLLCCCTRRNKDRYVVYCCRSNNFRCISVTPSQEHQSLCSCQASQLNSIALPSVAAIFQSKFVNWRECCCRNRVCNLLNVGKDTAIYACTWDTSCCFPVEWKVINSSFVFAKVKVFPYILVCRRCAYGCCIAFATVVRDVSRVATLVVACKGCRTDCPSVHIACSSGEEPCVVVIFGFKVGEVRNWFWCCQSLKGYSLRPRWVAAFAYTS